MKKLLLLVLTLSFITNVSVVSASSGLLAQIAQNLKSTRSSKTKKVIKKKMMAELKPKSSPLTEMQRKVAVLQKDGKTIGGDHHNQLMNELAILQKQGVNSSEIKKLREILSSLLPKKSAQYTMDPTGQKGESNSSAQALKSEIEEIGSKKLFLSEDHYLRLKKELDKLASQGEKNLDRYYAIIEKANPSAIYAFDQKQAERLKKEEEERNKVCDPKDYDPVLTHDFTDNSAIIEITAPGTPTGDKDGVKGHSWVWTSRQGENRKVPVYAPIAVYLEGAGGSYDAKSGQYDYGLDLRVADNNCWRIRYHHIVGEVVDSIKAAIQNKKEGGKIEPVSFKAGDLLGLTIGNVPSGNWDIGLYNLNVKGKLAHISQYVQHAVCWVDYYTPEKQNFYRSKLIGPKILCKF